MDSAAKLNCKISNNCAIQLAPIQLDTSQMVEQVLD